MNYCLNQRALGYKRFSSLDHGDTLKLSGYHIIYIYIINMFQLGSYYNIFNHKSFDIIILQD